MLNYPFEKKVNGYSSAKLLRCESDLIIIIIQSNFLPDQIKKRLTLIFHERCLYRGTYSFVCGPICRN